MVFNNISYIDRDTIVYFKDGNINNFYIDNLYLISRKEFEALNNNIINNDNCITELSDSDISSLDYYINNKLCLVYNVDEVWLDITEKEVPNVQPWYKISNYGRIYSSYSNKILRPYILNSGYYRVQIYGKNKEKIDVLPHRIMMMRFCPLDDYTGMEVNHIDGNAFNNSLNNVEWLPSLENSLYKAGAKYDQYGRLLTDDEVNAIKYGLANKMSYFNICNKLLGIPYDSRMHERIYNISKNKTYA